MEIWCFISAQTHYIGYRKWSSPTGVVLEQLHRILTGVYPNRILHSTTIETLVKESLPENNYQHFSMFQKSLNLEFCYLLVFILFLCWKQCVHCLSLTNTPAVPPLSHHTLNQTSQHFSSSSEVTHTQIPDLCSSQVTCWSLFFFFVMDLFHIYDNSLPETAVNMLHVY